MNVVNENGESARVNDLCKLCLVAKHSEPCPERAEGAAVCSITAQSKNAVNVGTASFDCVPHKARNSAQDALLLLMFPTTLMLKMPRGCLGAIGDV